ncbi:MAG: hypothetical protein OJF52_000801 [Nitrospira sp.]|jgi:hypothetical protein|nr:MAG: hypothetical protein OJF52_000801 [Nitrospira sp.]
MRRNETVPTMTGLDGSHAPETVDRRRISSRRRLSKPKLSDLTCHEGEVEDLLSEGESTST